MSLRHITDQLQHPQRFCNVKQRKQLCVCLCVWANEPFHLGVRDAEAPLHILFCAWRWCWGAVWRTLLPKFNRRHSREIQFDGPFGQHLSMVSRTLDMHLRCVAVKCRKIWKLGAKSTPPHAPPLVGGASNLWCCKILAPKWQQQQQQHRY